MANETRLIGSYVPKELTIVISHTATGVTMVLGGFASDSTVDIERGEAAWTHMVGTDGFVTRTHNVDETASATIHLNQTSSSNDFLSQLYTYDKNDLRGGGLFHCAIIDKSGRSHVYSDQSFVSTLANQSFGNAAGNRDWIITMPYADMHVGGNSKINADVANVLTTLGQVIPEDWLLT